MPSVAFLIIYISYNCIHTHKGIINENDIHQYMLNELSEYIINNSYSKKFEVVEDIEKFWKKYDNYPVWEASYVKNDEWINIKPSNEDILSNIQKLSSSFIHDCNDNSSILNNENSESSIFTFSDESNSTFFNISDDEQYISSASSSITNSSICKESLEINWESISNQEMENLLNINDD